MTVEAVLVPATLAVEPGDAVNCELHLRSTGDGPTEVSFQVRGEASAWTTVFPRAVSVPANGEAVARLVVSPPRASRPLAGTLPLEVEVVSTASGERVGMARGSLEVGPVVQLSAVITPLTDARRGSPLRHRLVLENRGNTVLRTDLSKEGSDALVLGLEPPNLTVEPGQSATATVTTRAPKTLLAGTGIRQRAFRVLVEPEGDAVVTVEGRVAEQGVLPVWAPKAAAGVGALMLAAGLAWATVLSPGGEDRGTRLETTAVDEPKVTFPPTAAPNSACATDGHTDGIGNKVHEEQRPEGLLPFDYSFMRVRGCTPARFNPCAPIHYVVNPAQSPPGGVEDVREAMRQLGEATGITFVDDGLTDETMPANSSFRQSYQPQRYGDRWAPILVAWERTGGGSEDQTVGRGGPTDVRDGVVITGYVGLNLDAVTNMVTQAPVRDGFGPAGGSGPLGPEGVTWGRVLLHELAHLAGLGHAGNRASLMYPLSAEQTARPARYSPNDRAGLRLLGRDAGCLPTPPPAPNTAGPGGPAVPVPPAAHGH